MNRHVHIASLLLCVACVLWGPRADAKMSIVYSKHNLSSSGPGQIKALTEGRICVFCHTPHNANPRTPLWNKNLSATNYTPYSSTTMKATMNQPMGPSRLCLSCHDGTIAIGDLLNPSGRVAMMNVSSSGAIPASSRSYIGTELEYHHPFSFSYYDASLDPWINPSLPSDLLFYNSATQSGIIECTTCHDPHDDTNKMFLRIDNTASALCIDCHATNATGWTGASHNTSQKSKTQNNPPDTDPWPRTGTTSDFQWTTVQQNGCENCHAPHGAGGPQRLLNYQNEEDNCYPCHDGNVASTNIYAEFQSPKNSRHEVEATTIGMTANHHDPNENPLYLTGHVECVDCHNPHASNSQTATAPVRSGKLAQVSGVSSDGQVVNPAQNEYEICFKCHANPSVGQYLLPPIPRVVSTVDLRAKFAMGNPSFHPVEGQGTNLLIPSFPSGNVLTQTLTATSVIYCTDCHDSDDSVSAGGTGPRGPHGSIYSPILKLQYLTADPTIESPSAYALCYWCHNRASILNDDSFKKNSLSGLGGHSGHLKSIGGTAVNTPCATCHDAHGVPVDMTSGSHTHLINFNTSIVTGIGSSPPIFTDNGTESGSCTLVCHGVTHDGSTMFSYP